MLLGTLLVAILVAHRRHTQQIHTAEIRLAAVSATEKLLAKWSAEGSWGATASTGQFEDNAKFSWRWTVTSSPQLQPIGAAAGRLEVIDNEGNIVTHVELLTADVIVSRVQ